MIVKAESPTCGRGGCRTQVGVAGDPCVYHWKVAFDQRQELKKARARVLGEVLTVAGGLLLVGWVFSMLFGRP
jgi:hypothetical protein